MANRGGRARQKRKAFLQRCVSPIRTGKADETKPATPPEHEEKKAIKAMEDKPKVEDHMADDATQTTENGKAAQPKQLALERAQHAQIPLFMGNMNVSPAKPRSYEPSSPLGSHKNIKMEDLAFGSIIGEGAFGKVYKARWGSRSVAVKVLICQDLSDEIARDFEAEVRIMSILHHPNICQLLGACLEPQNRALVMELSERGSLWEVLRTRRNPLSLDVRKQIAQDTARGMQYLHQFRRPILHRDLKSPNLLVQNSFRIKISDFGLARVKAKIKTMTGNCGTVQWMAPEVLASHRYTEKADVYSFGIVLWEIFSGECPFEKFTQIQVAVSVLNHDLRPSIPSYCPRFYARLMRACWKRDPDERPSFAHIVEAIQQEERRQPSPHRCRIR